MDLYITLRKEVEDTAEADQLFDIVKQKLADRPEIEIAGQVTNQLISDLPADPG